LPVVVIVATKFAELPVSAVGKLLFGVVSVPVG
jgi:hypothetical protein